MIFYTYNHLLIFCSLKSKNLLGWIRIKKSSDPKHGFPVLKMLLCCRGCGGEVYSTRGVATSPGFPAPFNQTSDCYWTLRVPPGRSSTLEAYLSAESAALRFEFGIS